MAGHPEPTLDELLWTAAAARLVLPRRGARPGPPNLSCDDFGAPARRRHRRLGRGLAGDGRPRQPGGAVAGDRAARRGDRGAGLRARAAARRLSRSTSPGRWIDPLSCRTSCMRADGEGLAPRRPLGGRHATRRCPFVAARRASGRLARRARRGRDRPALRRPRGGAPPRARRRRRAPPRGQRRHRHLRRHAERQLHERLLLPLRLLRVLEGPAGGEPAREAVPRPARRRSSAARARPGIAAPSRSASRAASIRGSPARPTSTSAARSRPSCPTSTSTPSRRSRSGRARRRSGSASRTTSAHCATPGSRRCRGRLRRSSTTRCARVICPDKVTTAQWLRVHDAAHRVGLRSTTTIMFGHVDGPRNWARHLLALREQQRRTGGFTEFVPLPFVHMEAPIYLKGRARPGPTFREALLMHAVARLALHPWITNVQASWVKLGRRGRAGRSPRGRERPRRDADERVDLARRRRRPRPGAAAGGDGGGDPRDRPDAAPADDALRRAAVRAHRRVVRRARRSQEPINPPASEAGLKPLPVLDRPGLCAPPL